jgi:hypothetical protein
VSSDGLATLLNLNEQNPRDEASKQRHQKLFQKLSNAAQTSFARHALNQDHIQFLSKMNNKAKERRKTKSKILEKAIGEGRVMKYEDIVAARARRAEQEAAQDSKDKAKCGRKPKSAPLESREGHLKQREAWHKAQERCP